MPVNDAEAGLKEVEKVIGEKFKDNPKKLKKWMKFLKLYFVKEWMKKVTPEVSLVYQQVDRTNNYLESYHRTLNEKLRTRPSTNLFVCMY